MERKVTQRGYAKINLHLDITGLMEGGFHAVRTVMQSISLYDEITLSHITECEGEPEFFVSCNIEGVPCDEKNLAVRAAKLFCEHLDRPLSAHIDIKKNIPMAAGMAGGSADGAATLLCLNKAMGDPLTLDELCRLGSQLGADVPFCIVGGTMYADGKGDRLSPFPKMPKCTIVAACEGEGVSTPWAYRLMDETYGFFGEGKYTPRNTESLKNALSSGDIKQIAENMYNIFEEPVLSQRPIAAEIKSLMLSGGALFAMMSGSGPSVFGIFEHETDAEKAVVLLEKNGYKGYICTPCERDA